MICVKIQAGFGNQLFQYAMGYSLSKSTGQELVLDISFNRYYQLKHKLHMKSPKMFSQCYLVNLRLEEGKFLGSPLKHWHQFIRRKQKKNTISVNGKKLQMRIEDFAHCREYQKDLLTNIPKEGVYLEGFWQNYQYFEDVKEDLQKIFNPNYKFNQSVLRIMNEIKRCNSVGVHIRRGDFIKLGWNQEIDYYINGISMMQSYVKDCVFFIFTDDKKWAREQFRNSEKTFIVEFESNQQDLDEFFLLKNCKHHIISESTFGWWAAYLNLNPNKIVIVPDKAVGGLFVNNWLRI